jgi:hypothetical protein
METLAEFHKEQYPHASPPGFLFPYVFLSPFLYCDVFLSTLSQESTDEGRSRKKRIIWEATRAPPFACSLSVSKSGSAL